MDLLEQLVSYLNIPNIHTYANKLDRVYQHHTLPNKE